MKQYEYTILNFYTTATGFMGTSSQINMEHVLPELNRAGADGWEIVGALPITEGYGRTVSISYTLKREKQ